MAVTTKSAKPKPNKLEAERWEIATAWNEHVKARLAEQCARITLSQVLVQYAEARRKMFFEALRQHKMIYCDRGEHYTRSEQHIYLEDVRRTGTSDHYYEYDRTTRRLVRACTEHFQSALSRVHDSGSDHYLVRPVVEHEGALMLRQGDQVAPLPAYTHKLGELTIDEELAAKFGLPPAVHWVEGHCGELELQVGSAKYSGIIDKSKV